MIIYRSLEAKMSKAKPWKIEQWSNGWDEDPDFNSPLFDLMAEELLENEKIQKVIRALNLND